MAASLYEFISMKFPHLTIQLITEHTDDHIKSHIFSNINKELMQNVIFANVVSVGVSFTHPVVAVFGFVTGHLLHPHDVIQLLG